MFTVAIALFLAADAFGGYTQMIQSLFKSATPFVTALAVLSLGVCAVMMKTSFGNPQKLEHARSAAIWTLIGLAVWYGAQGIIDMVVAAAPKG